MTTIIRNFRILTITDVHRFLTYLTEWRRFFTLATTPSNQQNLLLTMDQVLYLLEVFILAHYYGPPSIETSTTETTIVRCHKNSRIYLTSTYLLLVTFQTNNNYSIRFKISNYSSTIRFHEKKHYSHSTTIWSKLSDPRINQGLPTGPPSSLAYRHCGPWQKRSPQWSKALMT